MKLNLKIFIKQRKIGMTTKIEKDLSKPVLFGLNDNEIDEDYFKKLSNPSYDFEKEEEENKNLLYDAYNNIKDLLRKYCDLKEEDYPIIATWIIGTYFHDQFHSYPYLFLNAMKGSGKTRTLKLITDLSKDGEILLRPTEAVLFRTRSTLGIDEAEGLTRKGMEEIRELLNGCYKKGSKVKRMKQKKTLEGVEQVIEEFDIYRPLILANINGMEDVLGDRCISIILERSTNPGIVKLAEIWEDEKMFKKTKEILNQCRVCNVVVPWKLYSEWNNYIYTTYILYNNYTNSINYTELFKSLNLMDLNGREVELSAPLLFIAYNIDESTYTEVYSGIKLYMESRKQDQFNESQDVMLIDMVSQEPKEEWTTSKEILNKYFQFTQIENKDGEINSRWIGIALKRLNLIKDKKRLPGGMRYILNIKKAQEKIKQFK
jgi:hypothetical protein